jgi:hypothetical protein
MKKINPLYIDIQIEYLAALLAGDTLDEAEREIAIEKIDELLCLKERSAS